MNKISIPKSNPEKRYKLVIQRGSLEETPKAYKVICQKQEIEGITIPQGFEVWIPSIHATVSNLFSSRPMIDVPNWKLDEILRKIYLDSLRNG